MLIFERSKPHRYAQAQAPKDRVEFSDIPAAFLRTAEPRGIRCHPSFHEFIP